jgi:hypothetical protein
VGAGRRSWDAWHAGNYGSAAWQASMLGTEALGVRWAGQARWGGIRPTKNAYKLAKAGKLHGRTYEKYLHKPAKELRKGIRSFQKRIEEHRDKVANPQNYYPEWHTYPKDRQRKELRKWQIEIKVFTEHKYILEGILKNRKE